MRCENCKKEIPAEHGLNCHACNPVPESHSPLRLAIKSKNDRRKHEAERSRVQRDSTQPRVSQLRAPTPGIPQETTSSSNSTSPSRTVSGPPTENSGATFDDFDRKRMSVSDRVTHAFRGREARNSRNAEDLGATAMMLFAITGDESVEEVDFLKRTRTRCNRFGIVGALAGMVPMGLSAAAKSNGALGATFGFLFGAALGAVFWYVIVGIWTFALAGLFAPKQFNDNRSLVAQRWTKVSGTSTYAGARIVFLLLVLSIPTIIIFGIKLNSN